MPLGGEQDLAGTFWRGGFCQGIVSDRTFFGVGFIVPLLSDLRLMISLSLCTTIPATSCVRGIAIPQTLSRSLSPCLGWQRDAPAMILG